MVKLPQDYTDKINNQNNISLHILLVLFQEFKGSRPIYYTT